LLFLSERLGNLKRLACPPDGVFFPPVGILRAAPAFSFGLFFYSAEEGKFIQLSRHPRNSSLHFSPELKLVLILYAEESLLSFEFFFTSPNLFQQTTFHCDPTPSRRESFLFLFRRLRLAVVGRLAWRTLPFRPILLFFFILNSISLS